MLRVDDVSQNGMNTQSGKWQCHRKQKFKLRSIIRCQLICIVHASTINTDLTGRVTAVCYLPPRSDVSKMEFDKNAFDYVWTDSVSNLTHLLELTSKMCFRCWWSMKIHNFWVLLISPTWTRASSITVFSFEEVETNCAISVISFVYQ